MLAALTDSAVLHASIISLDKSFFVQMAVFLVFFVLLDRLVVRPMIRTQQARYDRMEGARREAERMELRATELHAEYRKRYDAARHEANQLREELRREAEQRADELYAKVRDEVERTRAEERRKLHQEADQARQQQDELADQLARQIVDDILSGRGGAA